MARSVTATFVVVLTPPQTGTFTLVCTSSAPAILSVNAPVGLTVVVRGHMAGSATLTFHVKNADGSVDHSYSLPCTLTNDPHNFTALILTIGQPTVLT